MLSILPLPLSKEYEAQAEAITSRFVGDASFFAYNGEEPEPEDPDAPPVERFRELHRLANVVQVLLAALAFKRNRAYTHIHIYTYIHALK